MNIIPAIPDPKERRITAMAQTILDCAAKSDIAHIETYAIARQSAEPSLAIRRNFEIALVGAVPRKYFELCEGMSEAERDEFNNAIAARVLKLAGGVG